MAQGYTKTQPLDTDVLLGAGTPSDYVSASQKAVKTYVDNRLSATDATDLTDGGVTTLHSHSKLVAADGSPDPALSADNAGALSSAYNFSQSGTADVFPQGSTYGLNTRFENLFGDDKPAVLTDFICDTLRVDNLGANVLGFNTNTTVDSDSYTPSSPFSKSNSGTVYFYVKNSYLRTNSLSGTSSLIWTSSTGKRFMNIIGQFPTRSGTTYGGEIRCWGVEAASLGGASPYWAVRFILDSTTYPDWPWRIKLYYGTGTSFASTNGTVVGDAPFNPFCDNRLRWDIGLRSPYGCVASCQEIHSRTPVVALDYTIAGTINFTTAKTIYVHTATSFQEFAIQEFEVI